MKTTEYNIEIVPIDDVIPYFKNPRKNDSAVKEVVKSIKAYGFRQPDVMLMQVTTQAGAGGMTDIYLDFGTYVKSFYSVMYHPSGVKINLMGTAHRRLHHKVTSNLTYPKILSETNKRRV